MALNKKIIGLSALVVGGILFMAWLAGLLHFGKIAPGLTPITGPPPQGRVLVVQETEIPRELEVLGAVISPSLSQVSSQVPGRVTKIWVEAGSRVKAGDPLVTLSAAEFKARVDQATAGLAQARAQLTQVTADYQRYQFLLKEGAVSPQEFDAMKARYQSATAALAQSQAVASEAATMKGYTVVRAPAAGVVAERKTAVGDLAQPGQALASLYDPDRLQIEGEVNDNYREQLKIGRGRPGQRARGEVRSAVSPSPKSFPSAPRAAAPSRCAPGGSKTRPSCRGCSRASRSPWGTAGAS